jgi:hypothetical protein
MGGDEGDDGEIGDWFAELHTSLIIEYIPPEAMGKDLT